MKILLITSTFCRKKNVATRRKTVIKLAWESWPLLELIKRLTWDYLRSSFYGDMYGGGIIITLLVKTPELDALRFLITYCLCNYVIS